ncbi:TetR/AcrR family transcriptional regulator [Luteipulveratus mongoliensis]|uniref:HTH tetR-type domain-containing protein n=1 Tax=Luteipulveratus mongoliensis TaxID=571913 RepID=A0A0K1JES3_9MICO|nr:TetR/AcrR family transcriptional regulator [Luteipulveratus mongoliensis]AKU15103.1 hypothetical protein VV02_03200 [Luteipulveratus mongoliensis]
MPSTREKVAEATRELLEAEGSAAVSMRRVAQSVGITPMALYRHYPNREGLLNEVCEEAFAKVADQWRSREQQRDSWADLLAIGSLLVDLAIARPHLYRYMFIDQRDEARQLPDSSAAAQSPTLSIVISGVTRCMDEGVFRRDDPLAVSLTLVAQLQGLIALYQGGRLGVDENAFRDLCHDCLRRVFHGLAA